MALFDPRVFSQPPFDCGLSTGGWMEPVVSRRKRKDDEEEKRRGEEARRAEQERIEQEAAEIARQEQAEREVQAIRDKRAEAVSSAILADLERELAQDELIRQAQEANRKAQARAVALMMQMEEEAAIVTILAML